MRIRDLFETILCGLIGAVLLILCVVKLAENEVYTSAGYGIGFLLTWVVAYARAVVVSKQRYP